jgi:alcohol dehydrogenase
MAAPDHADALVLTGPRSFERRSFPLPEVGDDDGLLRVEACGLCGTDHELFTGHMRTPGAIVPGHEVVGVLERAGPAAEARWGVRAGQRVAVEVFLSCRVCDNCRAGVYRRCERNGTATMVGFVPVEREPALWGGYATHLYLPPDALLLPVPDGLDPVLATVFNPLGAGIRWGATLPGTTAGDVVAVLGPGLRGIAACVAAKEAGASFVMLTGVGPRDLPRLEAALAFGADLTVDVSVDDPVRALRGAAGRLADVVVDVTAKAPAAFAQAVKLARHGGTVVVAGTRGDGVEAPGFQPDHVVYKELRVLGALGVDYPAYAEALRILASGKYPFAQLPRAVAGLDTVDPLLRTMAGEGDADVPVHAVVVP